MSMRTASRASHTLSEHLPTELDSSPYNFPLLMQIPRISTVELDLKTKGRSELKKDQLHSEFKISLDSTIPYLKTTDQSK